MEKSYPVYIRNLGQQDYLDTWQAMQAYTQARNDQSPDQLWIVEHPPVYTLGLNAKREHLLNIKDIPVVQSDRGGQVTYHGPGQLVVYTLLDIQRLHLNVRELVSLLETAMLTALAQYGLGAIAKPEAPGVYIAEKKIGSIGLRIKQGRCYHGLSLNNAMDLSPFQRINTCGFRDLEVTQLADLGVHIQTHELAIPILHAITEKLS
ncbi:MAG: lipoyl(octanoyl) transferase LipB [Methylococcaceae bacterium]|nr:lipoyl(octanoyl) transferase LipB [Methylococcaceae bacterium]